MDPATGSPQADRHADRYKWTALSNTTLGIFIAAMAGSFIGLILGGVLADTNWRLVFWINVPFGLFGTVWAYLKLKDTSARVKARIDWAGNVTFAAGLVLILVAITYGIQPYKHH